MNFSLSPAEQAFRDEFRSWLQTNAPAFDVGASSAESGDLAGRLQASRGWVRKLHEGRWAAISWPKPYGGREATPMEQFLFHEEMLAYRTPVPVTVIGIGMAGPTIMTYGTPAQRDRYLERIVSGEEIWCQGFSEPNAGSDLANLATSAVAEGDYYRVNGQKIWTSFGPIADWCLLVVRTDPAAAKHKGLSYLLVDMKSPGIEVRPIRQITGESEFSELFFTDVRVARENLLGQENDGWRVAITTLMHERANIAALVYANFKREFREVVALAKRLTRGGRPLSDDPVVRGRLVHFWGVVETMRLNNLRMRVGKSAADDPGPIGSIFKLIWATSNQAMQGLAVEVLGPEAELLTGPGSERGTHGLWLKRYIRSLANSIEGGTSEILRNIVAERVLGLGRAPAPKGGSEPMTMTGADETRMLRESAAAICVTEFPSDEVRLMVEEPTAISADGWAALAGQGWLGILVPERHGGLGLGVADLAVVLEELGHAAVPGPFWSAATLGVSAVALGESDGLRASWLDDLTTGARRATLALQEDGALPGSTGVGLMADPAGAGWVLTGSKRLVPDLVGADGIIVVAQGPEGPLVFLIEATRGGVGIEGAALTDSTSRSGTLKLDRVAVGEADRLGDWSLVERVVDYGNVGIAAMAVAGAQAVLDQALAYVKQRTQFGVPIGTFQAVQHPLANLFGEIESARSAYLYAAWAVDHGTDDVRRAVALARLTATAAYHHACTTSLQAHGGIAFTWEYDLHFHLKRAVHLKYLLGTPADYEEIIARDLLS